MNNGVEHNFILSVIGLEYYLKRSHKIRKVAFLLTINLRDAVAGDNYFFFTSDCDKMDGITLCAIKSK